MKNGHIFNLVSFAIGASPKFTEGLSVDEWNSVYAWADKQLLLGVVYNAVKRLPMELQPPQELTFQWASEAETIAGLNKRMNEEAVRLTSLFEAEGVATAILKGQANSRLYFSPWLRQPGDIDIWVDGGRARVCELLKKLNLVEGAKFTRHHVHLAKGTFAFSVEVHFLPSSGCFNPLASRRLQTYLNAEIRELSRVPEGFYVPSLKFALVMQLAHIQTHFYERGVGLRQLMDYYYLLKKSSPEEREEVAKVLKKLHLHQICEAVMWVLLLIFNLDREFMLCMPDPVRGNVLLDAILDGGNFGFYRELESHCSPYRFVAKRFRSLKLLKFNFWEAVFYELLYLRRLIVSIPTRIRLRKLSLRGVE